MKTNEELQHDVQDAIKWEVLFHAAEVGVTVKDGIVTLSGTVDSYMKKMEAEDAAKKVLGVLAVVQKMEILLDHSSQTPDDEIALAAANLFKWTLQTPGCNIEIEVENGWISLGGQLAWNYQKEVAQNSVSNITGVKGVSNNIIVKSESHDQFEKEDIENALRHCLEINEQHILVHVNGNRVILSGTVVSLFQKEEASRQAWNTAGVSSVENNLSIHYQKMLW